MVVRNRKHPPTSMISERFEMQLTRPASGSSGSNHPRASATMSELDLMFWLPNQYNAGESLLIARAQA